MKDYFGKPIKKLGFGLMRLPLVSKQPDSDIDLEQVKEMVDLYLERGFTYFDTAFVYNEGKSEEAFREAVAKRYSRDEFQVTTKLPLWQPLTYEEMTKFTQISLERMGLDYFDLYFLHGVGPDRLEMINEIGAWEYLKELKKTGKTKNIGFSYHGDAKTLNSILEKHAKDLDIIQIQANYLDWEDEKIQSRKCYEAVIKHGLGVIIMEPIKGGSLANFTPNIANIFKEANPEASIASWALRFPLSLPGVVVVLSGMSTLEQVMDNTVVADKVVPLSKQEMKVIEKAMKELKKIPTIPCTKCGYCVADCPQKINTPRIIAIMNDYLTYNNLASAKRMYDILITGAFGGMAEPKASTCIECGSCEKHCPQQIKIIDIHKKIAELFE